MIKREMSFDYIFLDPPYKQQKLQQLLEFIDEQQLLNESGSIMCEHGSEIRLDDQSGKLAEGKGRDLWNHQYFDIFQTEKIENTK